MGLELGTVLAALEVRDNFSSKLEEAADGVDKFEKKVTDMGGPFDMFSADAIESFGAVSAAVALMAGAAVAAGAAVFALASRGADVLDIAGTLEHFSGSAAAAEANLEGLRSGVQNTVDDMTLMQNASRMLSAGVKLNADDFNTLGSAAFVMQNRGLGTTAEMMDLLSDSMITGRTRALAMKLGVVDLGDAAANYAKQLGVEVNMLSDAAKAEATRIQIMKMLGGAVKDAGVQEKDFGEKVDTMLTSFKNWTDELAKAITQSPVLTHLMDQLGAALGGAFDEKQSGLIATIVEWIDKALIFTVNIGIATVEAARVIHVAWSVVETIVLGVEMALAGMVAVVADVTAGVLGMAASMPGATEGMKAAAAGAAAFAEDMHGVTAGFELQAQEAAKGIVGNSEFDAVLDKMGGTLFKLKDGMVAAGEATADHTDAVTLDTIAQQLAEAAAKRNTASMLDQAKVQKLAAEAALATTAMWNEYETTRIKQSGTTTQGLLADIELWKLSVITAAKEAGKWTQEYEESVEARSAQKRLAVTVDLDFVKSKTIATLEEQRDKAKATYDHMRDRASEFTRGTLQEQFKKWKDLEFAATRMGQEGTTAQEKMKAAADKSTLSFNTQIEAIRAAEKAQRALNNSASLSFEVTRETVAANAKGLGGDLNAMMPLLLKGYSFQQALLWSKHSDWEPPASIGPRVAGFAEGGVVMVGERGPEAVRLPFGSAVFPNGTSPGGGGNTFIFQVNGTDEASVRKMEKLVMNRLKLVKHFGSA